MRGCCKLEVRASAFKFVSFFFPIVFFISGKKKQYWCAPLKTRVSYFYTNGVCWRDILTLLTRSKFFFFLVGKFTQRKLQKFRKWAPKKKKRGTKHEYSFRHSFDERCSGVKSPRFKKRQLEATKDVWLVKVAQRWLSWCLSSSWEVRVFGFFSPESLPLSCFLWGCARFKFSFPGCVKRLSGNVWHPHLLVLLVRFSLSP